MKKWICFLFLLVPCAAGALELSDASRREAKLYTTFIEAVYAQLSGDPRALDLFKEALSYSPDNAYIKRNIVATAIMQDRFDETEAYADFITEESDAEDWTVRAAYLLKENQIPQALQAYEQALKLAPDDTRIAYQYMLVLAYAGDTESLEKMEDLAQRFTQMAATVYLEMGRIYWRDKNAPAALEYYNKACEADPFFVDARLARAQFYERTSNFFLMLYEFEQLEKMGYESADMFTRMGSVFLISKDTPKAKQYFEKAVKLEPGNPSARYFLTVLAEQEGDYALALEHLQAARDYQQTSGKWLQASFYQQKLGDSKTSLNTLKQAYKKFNDSVEIGYFYALALQDAGKPRTAARVLKKIIKARPEYADARLAYAYVLDTLKKYKQLEEQINALLAQNENMHEAMNLWAYSLAIRGVRLQEAQKYAEKAVSLSPQDASYQDTLAWVYFQQGKLERALDLLQNIDRQALVENAEIAYHLAAVYAAMGQKDKAVVLLQNEATPWPLSAPLLEKINH